MFHKLSPDSREREATHTIGLLRPSPRKTGRPLKSFDDQERIEFLRLRRGGVGVKSALKRLGIGNRLYNRPEHGDIAHRHIKLITESHAPDGMIKVVQDRR